MDVLAKKVTFGNGITLPAGVHWMAFDGGLDKTLKAHRTTIAKFVEELGVVPVKQKKNGRNVKGLFIRDIVAVAKHRTKGEHPAFDEASWSKASNGTAIVFQDAAQWFNGVQPGRKVRIVRPPAPEAQPTLFPDPTLSDVLNRLFFLEDLVVYLCREWGGTQGEQVVANAKLTYLGARRR